MTLAHDHHHPAFAGAVHGEMPRDKQDESRIASASDAPQCGYCCLTEMFPDIQPRLYPSVAQR
jgi:hypothetical protein